MKKIILLLFLASLMQIVNAQTPVWKWAVGAGGGSVYQYSNGLAIDDSGFLYIGGRFAGTITFGSQTTTDTWGGDILYASKFDTTGNCIWLKSHGFSGSNDYPRAFSIDHAIPANIYDCGVAGSATLGMYALKYNSGGTYQWGLTNGTGSYYGQNPEAHGIAADIAGNVYVTGETGGGAWTFGDSTISYAGTNLQEMFLTKMDNTGHFLWAVGANGLNAADDGYDVGRAVVIDNSAQYIYVAGSYTGTPSFHSKNPADDIVGPPSQSGVQYANLFVAKYDTAGNLIWVTYGINAGIPDVNVPWSTDVGASYSMAIDSCDNIFITGNYTGAAVFGQVSINSVGTNDGFLATCNSNGEWQWANDIGSPGAADYGGSVTVDKDDDVYLGTTINGTANFGSGVTATVTQQSACVIKYSNSTGAAQWVLTATGPGSSSDGGIAVDKNKFVYFTGSYSGSITIGSNTLPSNSFGLFIAKLDTIHARYIVPVVSGTYCPGSTVTLPYTTVGTFNSNNVFTAELSNDTGSFLNYAVLGSVNSDTSGTISITIPANTTPGSDYLIRVVSSSPATSSYANGCGLYFQNNVYINNFYITIGGSSSLSILTSADTICSGGAVELIAGGGTSYLWSTGATSDTITLNPTSDTTIFLTATGGCSGNDSINLTVNAAPPLTISPQSPTVCNGTSVMLIADTSGSNYAWSPSAGLSAISGDSVLANPTITTIYTVTGVSALGCSVTGIDTVKFNTPTGLDIYPFGGASICSGQTVTLKVPTSGSNYVWSPSTNLSATTGDSVIANPTADITYSVTGMDSLGCTVTGTEAVNVSQGPNKPTITVSITGDTLTSSAVNGNQWYVNGKPISGATGTIFAISGLPNGDTVSVEVTDIANGCSTTSNAFITGISQLSVSNYQVSIYPNPTNGNVNVNISLSAEGVKSWNLQVTDVLGRTLYTRSALNYKNEIDLSNLPGRVYFITIINKTSRVVFPVVKQN